MNKKIIIVAGVTVVAGIGLITHIAHKIAVRKAKKVIQQTMNDFDAMVAEEEAEFYQQREAQQEAVAKAVKEFKSQFETAKADIEAKSQEIRESHQPTETMAERDAKIREAMKGV